MYWVALTVTSTVGFTIPNTGCGLIAPICFNRMKGPQICFVFMKSTSRSVSRLNVVPLYLQKIGGGWGEEGIQNKIEKQITNETNRWVRAHTFSKPTALPAWRLIREKLGGGGGWWWGEVSKTCAVYCELGLRACPPLALAINTPHSEMCTQPMDSVNRFRTLRCPVHLGCHVYRLWEYTSFPTYHFSPFKRFTVAVGSVSLY